MTSFSSAPFASNHRHLRTPEISRRVFTRTPFATAANSDQVGAGPSIDLSFSRSDAAPLFAPLVPKAEDLGYHLHPRDRSLYAWFHSIGMLLTLVAVGATCVALVIG
jgi:hypothetical protein